MFASGESPASRENRLSTSRFRVKTVVAIENVVDTKVMDLAAPDLCMH